MDAQTKRKFARARRLFPHTKKVAYFNSASTGPFCTPVATAIGKHLEFRLAAERDDSHAAFSKRAILRRDYAKLVGARADQVGLGLNTSFGLNVAAFGLPMKRGEEILVSDVDFPASPYAFRAAAEARGLKLKFVKSRNHQFDMGELDRAATRKSRLLAVSWVQFHNGFKNNLKELSAFCKAHGMYFVVDGIQGMGVEPINVRKLGIDVFTSGCQKWMLSPQGCGFFYVSDDVRDKMTPPFMSWLSVDWKMNFTDLLRYDLGYPDSAQKFELGYYVVLNLFGMEAAVQLFKDIGIRNIQRHNYELINHLADYIRSSPFYAITSSMTPRHRSSIFTFTCDGARELFDRLTKAKIITAFREGSIRVAVHLFNDGSDIDRLVGVLERFASGR